MTFSGFTTLQNHGCTVTLILTKVLIFIIASAFLKISFGRGKIDNILFQWLHICILYWTFKKFVKRHIQNSQRSLGFIRTASSNHLICTLAVIPIYSLSIVRTKPQGCICNFCGFLKCSTNDLGSMQRFVFYPIIYTYWCCNSTFLS